jgi:hypothetical protein
MTLLTLSGLEDMSTDLVEPVRCRMERLCAEPREHSRFLNMLSLMEHIGSRKIITSQTGGPLGCEVLKHLSEEARHAYFFKRQAERIAGRTLDYSERDTLAPTSARMYFGRLDAGVSRALGRGGAVELPYLYVSMIIELRAIWAYRLYHDVLMGSDTGISLKSVLAEEELHLPQMAERIEALGETVAERLPAFTRLEDGLFRGLWRAIATEPAEVRVAVH